MLSDAVGAALAGGLGVLLWRLGANVPTVNDDPVAGVSPADLLSAPWTHVAAAGLSGCARRVCAAGAPERSQQLAIIPAVADQVVLMFNVIIVEL